MSLNVFADSCILNSMLSLGTTVCSRSKGSNSCERTTKSQNFSLHSSPIPIPQNSIRSCEKGTGILTDSSLQIKNLGTNFYIGFCSSNDNNDVDVDVDVDVGVGYCRLLFRLWRQPLM
jgi:hypothetical protein